MAAPPRGWASTIGTAALKSVLLSAAVLIMNFNSMKIINVISFL
jgi:hypothetical protein